MDHWGIISSDILVGGFGAPWLGSGKRSSGPNTGINAMKRSGGNV
jgi:hypothetical protein